jgi:carboxylesterase type B
MQPVLGFFDAAEIGGTAYEDSANVEMTDLVAALKWVHENIENFGGDPDRVMIYGQSGGGSKVTTLMGMPSAAGMFHRASAQSGGGGNIPSRDQQKELASGISECAKIQTQFALSRKWHLFGFERKCGGWQIKSPLRLTRNARGDRTVPAFQHR